MTSLEQLMIRGVRSVGTAEEDAHIIRFLNPLTIISGPNGSGKTTLIEALNYITTGALPAGKLNTFIHSLDIARKPRVDGMVKLQFRDAKGRQCVATKRMNISKAKGGKSKCQSDEFNVLINHNGISKSLSSKVADFQKEMLNLFGVPPAILDHVIFCHQEESCWPLSEPKELKIRFDKIFQLTKFVKAIDQMKKLRKEYDMELRVLQEKTTNAEMVLQSKAKYIQSRNETAVLKQDIAKRIKELRGIVSSSIEVVKKGNEELIIADTQGRELDKKRTQYQMFVNQLSSMRVSSFDGTETQLRALIKEISDSPGTGDIELQREAVQGRIMIVERDMESSRQTKKTIEANIMDLMSAEMHREGLNADLAVLTAKLAEHYGDAVDVGNVSGSVHHHLGKLRRDLEMWKISSREERQKIQNLLEQKQNELTRMDVELESGEQAMQKIVSDIQSAERRLGDSAGLESELSKIGQEVLMIEESLSRLPDVDESKLKQLHSRRQSLQIEINQLRDEASRMEHVFALRHQIETKENEHRTNIAKLNELLSNHRDDFIAIYGEVPDGPYSPKVEQYVKRCKPLLAATEKEFSEIELAVDRYNQSLMQITEEITTNNRESDELQKKIMLLASCGPEDVDNKLRDVRARLIRTRSELSPLDSKKTLYEKWSSEVQEKSCCPLCDRKFNSKCGVRDLSTKLMNMSLSFPGEVEKLKQDVEISEAAERDLLKASNYAEQLRRLNDSARQLSTKKIRLEEDLASSSQSRSEKAVDLQKLKALAERVNRIQIDVSLLDALHKLISDLQSEVGELRSSIPAVSNTMSPTDFKTRITSKEHEMMLIIEEADTLQNLSADRSKLTGQLQNLRERRIEMGENAAQVTHIEEQLKAKKDELNLLMQRMRELESLRPNIQNELQNWKTGRLQYDNTANEKERELSAKIYELESGMSRYEDLKQRAHALSNNQIKIHQLKETLAATDTQITEYSALKSHLESQMNDLNGLDAQRQTLENQLTKIILQRRVETIKSEIAALELSTKDIDDLRTKVASANRDREQAEIERGRISGQLEEVDKKHREAVSFLAQNKYSSAEQIYRDAVIDKVTHEHLIQDVVNYGGMLDNCLLSFHTDKMAAINDILDDLWRRVYKGSDIETIKIISEAATSTDKRKSYDYRVVMVVDGGTEIDMRDRCSAGQKMLACILIRIALADVFGGLCSIIALDEPTTNLDSGKVDHIAEMLNELIAARRNVDDEGNVSGRQFQMIVITHDERLVEKLTLGSRPEFTYVLGKDVRGISYIRRQYADGRQERTA